MITTQRELRDEFWRQHPRFKRRMVKVGPDRYRQATQNDYPTDVRVAWCDWVDHMNKSNQISDALAERATL